MLGVALSFFSEQESKPTSRNKPVKGTIFMGAVFNRLWMTGD
jgi:hypothetical protein